MFAEKFGYTPEQIDNLDCDTADAFAIIGSAIAKKMKQEAQSKRLRRW